MRRKITLLRSDVQRLAAERRAAPCLRASPGVGLRLHVLARLLGCFLGLAAGDVAVADSVAAQEPETWTLVGVEVDARPAPTPPANPNVFELLYEPSGNSVLVGSVSQDGTGPPPGCRVTFSWNQPPATVHTDEAFTMQLRASLQGDPCFWRLRLDATPCCTDEGTVLWPPGRFGSDGSLDLDVTINGLFTHDVDEFRLGVAVSDGSLVSRVPSTYIYRKQTGPSPTPLPTSTPTPTGSPGSDCCAQRGGTGCESALCEACVCLNDESCCDTQWDAACAENAAGPCNRFCGCTALPTLDCPHTSLTNQTFGENGEASYSLSLAATSTVTIDANLCSFLTCEEPAFVQVRSGDVLLCQGDSPLSCLLGAGDYEVTVFDLLGENPAFAVDLDCVDAGVTVTPIVSATATRSFTSTRTPTRTGTRTPTRTGTPTRTTTPTPSRTATLSPTKTPTGTLTVTPTPTPTRTSTRTPTPTLTLTWTPTSTWTSTSTPTPVLCGNGSVDSPMEECDDGENNSDTEPNACRTDCTLPRCGDHVIDDESPFDELCDDGNRDDGDGCPADCKYQITMSPRLVFGLGLCGAGTREVQVWRVDSGGNRLEEITQDPRITYLWIGGGLPREVADEAAAALGAEIIDLAVNGGQVSFAPGQNGLNVIQAVLSTDGGECGLIPRPGCVYSNYTVAIGGGDIAKAKGLEIGPLTTANVAVDTLGGLLTSSLAEAPSAGDPGEAEESFGSDPPMILFPSGRTCEDVDVGKLGTTGIVVVKKLTFDLFGGRVEGVDLVQALSQLIQLAAAEAAPELGPAGPALIWLAAATSDTGSGLVLSQFLDFELSAQAKDAEGGERVTEDAVIKVSDGFSLEVPFLKGTVMAKGPAGFSAVQATLDLEDLCLGKATDTMLVWVAPKLEAVGIRNEKGMFEDPLDLYIGQERRPSAVGMFSFVEGTPPISFDTIGANPTELVELLNNMLPGMLHLPPDIIEPFVPDEITIPLGAELIQGLYREGPRFMRFKVDLDLTAGTFVIKEMRLQLPLPTTEPLRGVASWKLTQDRDPPVVTLDPTKGGVVGLTGKRSGTDQLQLDGCFPFLVADPPPSDFNGVRVSPCNLRIQGRKFYDNDLNGERNGLEPALNGWTIHLFKGEGTDLEEIGAQETGNIDGADGRYDFGSVDLQGDRVVMREDLRDGWEASPSATRVFPLQHIVGDDEMDCPPQLIVNFGNTCSPRVTGIKFEDRDGEGDRDASDPGLNGWTIELAYTEPDPGVGLPPPHHHLATTVTRNIDGEDGRYDFGNVMLNTEWDKLVITEIPQPRWQAVGSTSREITLAEVGLLQGNCPQEIGADFANACEVVVSGTKFEDLDGDGVQGAAEPGIDFWGIEVVDRDGRLISSDITTTREGRRGRYEMRVPVFRDRVPYTIREESDPRFEPSNPEGGETTLDGIETCTVDTYVVDFGNIPLGPSATSTTTSTASVTPSITTTPSATKSRTSTPTLTSTPTATPRGPAIVRIVPDFASQGTADLELEILGINFEPGAAVSFEPPTGITLVPPSPPNFGFEGPTELRQSIDVASDAPLGLRRVFVTNPDGPSGGISPYNQFFVATAEPGPCTGDCNGDNMVSEDEIATGINIPFDPSLMQECPQFDHDRNGRVSAAEIIAAINDSIIGCEGAGP